MSASVHFRKGILIALMVTLADLWTKYLAFVATHNGADPIYVSPNLNIVYWLNTGVSFGMFADISNAQLLLSFVSGIIITMLIFWMRRSDNFARTVALAFIVGGALGNLIDRLANGGVGDFIDLHAGGMHWPAFNLADTAIFVGVVHIIWVEYKAKS